MYCNLKYFILSIYISKKGSWTDMKASQDPDGDPGSNTAYAFHASFNNDEDDGIFKY